MNMFNCEYCGKPISDNPTSKTGHLRKCNSYKNEKDRIINSITKEFLEEDYVKKEKSVTVIAKELGLKKPYPITEKLKEFDIYIRTFSEGRKAKDFIERTKKTCNEKYGADYHTLKTSTKRKEIDEAVEKKYGVKNVFQTDFVKEKIKETCLDKYGAINPLSKDTEIYNKRNETVFNKYGVENIFQNQEIIKKSLDSKYNKEYVYTQSSKKADNLFKIILENNDNDSVHCSIKGKEFGLYDNIAKKYRMFDFVDTKLKKCIEFNGNYWHANPLKYHPDYFNKKAKLTAAEIWKLDKEKQNKIIELGYDLLIIWESEYDETPNLVIDKCLKFLKS